MIGSLVDTTMHLMSSPWVYLLIVLIALADALAPVVPSETVVITAGVFAASGTTEVPLIIASAAVGAMIGDHLAYLIGRMTSRRTGGGGPAGWRARTIRRAGALLAERGGMALVVARFVPGGRTAVTLGMGALHHPLARFTAWDAIAAFSWAGYCTAVGVVGATPSLRSRSPPSSSAQPSRSPSAASPSWPAEYAVARRAAPARAPRPDPRHFRRTTSGTTGLCRYVRRTT